MNNFYTYAYLREDGSPYYIGKGAGNRLRANHKRRNGRYIAVPQDPSRILILKRFNLEEDAFKHEKYMINVLGRKSDNTGILINLTDGGEGISGYKHTEEFKRFQREIPRKPHSEESKQKMRIARYEQPCPRTGKTHTDEAKDKMRDHKCKYVYELVSPEGKKYVTHSSTLFCKQHPEFELNSPNILKASRRLKPYKGWSITRRER